MFRKNHTIGTTEEKKQSQKDVSSCSSSTIHWLLFRQWTTNATGLESRLPIFQTIVPDLGFCSKPFHQSFLAKKTFFVLSEVVPQLRSRWSSLRDSLLFFVLMSSSLAPIGSVCLYSQNQRLRLTGRRRCSFRNICTMMIPISSMARIRRRFFY